MSTGPKKKIARLGMSPAWKQLVRDRLTELGWTKSDLARAMGVDKTVIGSMLDHQAVSGHVARVCEVLNIPLPNERTATEIEQLFDALSPEDQQALLVVARRMARQPQ